MIIHEDYVSDDGRKLVRTYSDRNVYIERNDGVKFVDAIDPICSERVYKETEENITPPPND